MVPAWLLVIVALTLWARYRPDRPFTDRRHRHGDLADGSREAVLPKVAGSSRVAVTSIRCRVPETALAFEKTLSTTIPSADLYPCGRVHGRRGLRQVPQKSLRRAIRAPDEHGL